MNFHPKPRITETLSGILSEEELRIQRDKEKIRERPARPPHIPPRAVVCYECRRSSEVPLAALSAKCCYCHAYINLGDVTIFPGSSKRRIRTQGDVLIRSDVNINHLNICCHKLAMQGKGSGSFHCTGTMSISSETSVAGWITAHTLHIERRGSVTLRKGARVQDALIQGTLMGTIQAMGRVTIARGGRLLGDVAAAELVIDEGGIHRGQRFLPPQQTTA